jgi:predicted permease
MSWRRFFWRRWWDDERAREIASYLEIETADNIARGLSPAEASAAARRKFGNPVLVREEIYGMNTVAWLENSWKDLRYGARLLRLSPGFALVAIVSLALGIGANTAIFQLLDAVRLRSLPVQNPQELVEVRIVGGNLGVGVITGQYAQLTRPLWSQIRQQQQTFSGMFAWSSSNIQLGQGADAQNLKGLWVSGDFFQVLGIQPWRGRPIMPSDDGACPRPVAVVSYSYWQREMGGRELDADSKLEIVDGATTQLTQVVGVTPPGFFGMAVGENFDIMLPLCGSDEDWPRNRFIVSVMGRLRPGWTSERASSQLDAVSPGIFEATALTGYGQETTDKYKHFRLAAYPAGTGVSALRDRYDSSLWLLLAITGLVLLIACANLANLMLARAAAREREIAVRLALGATRLRLLRQLIAESALLAVLGMAGGIVLAHVLSRVLVWSISAGDSPVNLPITTDWRVFGFAATATALTCLIFGAAPALRATRVQEGGAMKATGRGLTSGRERFSLQRLMVVTQIAVSLVLLFAALLFVRSFNNLMNFDPGIREQGVTVAYMEYPQSHVPPDHLGEFKRRLLDEVRSVPGVTTAATTTMVPLLNGSWGHHVHVGALYGPSKFTWVSPGYFQTMGVTLLTGRDFTDNDTAATGRVAVVNQNFVRQFVGDDHPIGKTVRTDPEPGYPSTVYEIVGVIPDTQYNDLRGATPAMVFAPETQYPAQGPYAAMMVHSNAAPAAIIAGVKSKMAETHPEITLGFYDFQQEIRNRLVPERLMAMLSGFFGLLAALLAMVGLYGVISFIVTRRQNEIGIRVALGARRGQIVSMVMREAALLVVIGSAIGIALSIVAGASASSLLFGMKSYDPTTLAAATGLLAVIAASASLIPALRAARLDPMDALRCQ